MGDSNSRIVRIGAASAFYNDSQIGIAQLLAKGGELNYVIFDFLSESVVAGLGRSQAEGGGGGYAADFADGYILPHLASLLDRGIKVIANAGGLNPAACAKALRAKAKAIGLSPRIGVIEGDDLTGRSASLVTDETRDMFDGSSVADRLAGADRVDSLIAYTGAFPIAAALGAGADIVITGRAVDSALTLGPLIHEFGWGQDDFDRLAAGTLAGHLLECSAQATGGTFTDWRDVPDWAGIGMPIGECGADGSLTITKPEGTGGLVSIGTIAEQLLYEVSDPQAYIVPDVVADFSEVRLVQASPDRVTVSGVRGRGRTDSLKASLTYDEGWRASALIPITGLEAAAKARRVGDEVFARTAGLLRQAQRPPFTLTRCDVVGGESDESTTVICRLVADHRDRAGAELLVREQNSAISHMAVGISLGLGAVVRPVQRIVGFLIPKLAVGLRVSLDDVDVPIDIATDARAGADGLRVPALPAPPTDTDPACTVPLIRLAWARSGDKGNLFNVAVIAREPRFWPYVVAALTPETVGAWYSRVWGYGQAYAVDRFAVPGLSAINFVVRESMEGGVMASPRIDPVAKGMAQLLLNFPVQVSPAIYRASD